MNLIRMRLLATSLVAMCALGGPLTGARAEDTYPDCSKEMRLAPYRKCAYERTMGPVRVALEVDKEGLGGELIFHATNLGNAPVTMLTVTATRWDNVAEFRTWSAGSVPGTLLRHPLCLRELDHKDLQQDKSRCPYYGVFDSWPIFRKVASKPLVVTIEFSFRSDDGTIHRGSISHSTDGSVSVPQPTPAGPGIAERLTTGEWDFIASKSVDGTTIAKATTYVFGKDGSVRHSVRGFNKDLETDRQCPNAPYYVYNYSSKIVGAWTVSGDIVKIKPNEAATTLGWTPFTARLDHHDLVLVFADGELRMKNSRPISAVWHGDLTGKYPFECERR